MPPYQAQFATGCHVRVQTAAVLAHFHKRWTLHHALTVEMLSFAGQEAVVKTVSFFHGGDVLYTLSGIPGTWHEACLCLPESIATQTLFELDGTRFSTLEGFYDEVSRVLIPESDWGHNLDGFNDILRGGFGTPYGGFTIRWLHHVLSIERLGYPETVRQLELRLAHCHPASRPSVLEDLARARRGEGTTAFDWLLEIIRRHGEGGDEAIDCITLELR